MARRGLSLDGLAAAMIKDIRKFTNDRVDGIEDDMLEVAVDAADEMQRIISSNESSTPTGLARGNVGRIDTGAMYQSAGQVDVTRDKSQVAARFGYRDNGEEYMVYQDRGFNHAQANRWIEGTNALLTAFGKAREALHEKFMSRGLRGKGF